MVKISLLLLLLSFPVASGVPYSIENWNTPNGMYSRIINYTSYTLFCYIGNAQFYVQPYKPGRWYRYSPYWQCKYI